MRILKTSIGLLALLAAVAFSGVAIAAHGGGGHGGGGHGGGYAAGGHGGGHGGGYGGYRGGYGGYGGYGRGYGGGYGWWGGYGLGIGYAAIPYYYNDYYQPAIGVPMDSPGYIEQDGPAIAPQQDAYYCENPQGYYPYVQQCASGWQRVSPNAPSGYR